MSDNINVITQNIEQHFNQIENEIFSGELFSSYRGSFEVKKIYVKKENSDIKCDLEIRLNEWPEGIYIKVYKHKALGVLPYTKDEQLCKDFLKIQAIPCKFWKESFYFSHQENLDQERYVKLEGNSMTSDDTHVCITRIQAFIEEINSIIINN